MIKYKNKHTGEVKTLTPAQHERFFDNRDRFDWEQPDLIDNPPKAEENK